MSYNANLQNFIIGQTKSVNQNALNGSCGIKLAEIVTIFVAKIKFLTKHQKNVNQIVLNGNYSTKLVKNVTISVAKPNLLIRHRKNANQIALNGNYITKLVKNVKTYVVQSKILTPQPKNVIINVALILNGIILHKNVFVIKAFSFWTTHVWLK